MTSTSTPDRIEQSRSAVSFRSEGFTLIEVMISIVLLAMISVAIYQSTTQTFRYRSKIINEGDFYGGIRLAMGLMDRDVSALFSPVNLNPKNFPDPSQTPAPGNGGPTPPGFPGMNPGPTGTTDPAQLQQLTDLQNSELGKESDFWLGATDLTGIRPSRFVGTENRISFVASSHLRIYKNSQESEFSKIVYELRDDPDSGLGDDAKILVKIEDPDVFDTEEKKGKSAKVYPLLSGMKKFVFRYYRKDKKWWELTWDTNREEMKGLYPDLIELTIQVVGIAKLNFEGVYMFKPETPFYGLDSTF